MDEKIATLNAMIQESKRIVFFGGAGVSTESGIPDFRSADGLYNQTYQYPPEMIVSHTFYEECPEEFFDFYKNRMLFLDAKPNAAHLKLAELEKAGKLTAVITQNIDGLHQAAGSKNVLELHGSVLRNYCMQCGKPSCVAVCPVNATDKREEGGIVSQIPPRCFGCRYCMASCPYHARYFNWYDPKWPGDLSQALTPDVSTRMRGVVEKCSFCHHRFMKAQQSAAARGEDPMNLPDGAYVTACTEACPMDVDVVKTPNSPECIRCGKCITVCPMNLEPVFMYMYYSKGDYENMEKFHILDCFECGSCSFNCPARMPLTHAFKTAKLMFQAKAAKERAEAEAKAAKEAQK